MIPIKLTLSGFLSYRDPVELDFTSFELACISGQNGAGKSTLLDAITWALFGQARKRDDSLVNMQSNAAEVSLSFRYEGNTYRVQRTKPRGKTGTLEFQILQKGQGASIEPGKTANLNIPTSPDGMWKVLTERTSAETQARIEQTLRMDYETFINASFFLQGKADIFATETPSKRKQILSSILGLEQWEVYRQRAADRRKQVEAEISSLDGRLAEIEAELSEEPARVANLAGLQKELKRLSKNRHAQEQAVEAVRKVAATLAEQRRLVEVLARQVEAARQRQRDLQERLLARQEERQSLAGVLANSDDIEAAYADYQERRAELARWEETAARFREQESQRMAPQMEIEAELARLTQEAEMLRKDQAEVADRQSSAVELSGELEACRQALALAETALQRRLGWDADLQMARQRQTEARAENPRLRSEMDELKKRMERLSAVEGAVCPFCGQPLAPQDRQRLIDDMAAQGKEMGDRFRTNQAFLSDAEQLIARLEAEGKELAVAEAEQLTQATNVSRLEVQLQDVQQRLSAWETVGAPRLAEIEHRLEAGDYAWEARRRLAEIDAGLKATGYDAAAHDAARRAEAEGRAAEDELRLLDQARAALAPLEREINDLESQAEATQAEAARQQQEYDQSAAALAAAEAQAPDLDSAERALLDLQEQENHLRLEVGAARQKVQILDDLKARRDSFQAGREEKARLVAQLKQLERAFGKDGIPALLIEQALPQIEARANDLLDRLSGGNMTVRFVTQAAFKDKRREDLKETLDIQISDGAGTRDYELYSGGEAFRVNFAVRLALSEVLAQRAGARLQTLVIDEGFGSQDALGRQRLVEAINLVRKDFARVLVITHIDELKEAFPHRIEVEKTERGSIVRVL